jgi:hypothetical protein
MIPHRIITNAPDNSCPHRLCCAGSTPGTLTPGAIICYADFRFMRILLTNDDGIYADGLHAAWRALNAAGHDVFVCVPDRPRSAVSHGITIYSSISAR